MQIDETLSNAGPSLALATGTNRQNEFANEIGQLGVQTRAEGKR